MGGKWKLLYAYRSIIHTRIHDLIMTIKIGRSPDLDYVIADPSVSRQHAELHNNGGGGWHIRDVGSSGGTFLIGPNGSPRQISQADVLPSDVLVFGGVRVAVADIIRTAKKTGPSHGASAGGRFVRCGCGAVIRDGGACSVCGKA